MANRSVIPLFPFDRYVMKSRTISFLKATYNPQRKLGKLEDNGFPECGGTKKGMSKQVVLSIPVPPLATCDERTLKRPWKSDGT